MRTCLPTELELLKGALSTRSMALLRRLGGDDLKGLRSVRMTDGAFCLYYVFPTEHVVRCGKLVQQSNFTTLKEIFTESKSVTDEGDQYDLWVRVVTVNRFKPALDRTAISRCLEAAQCLALDPVLDQEEVDKVKVAQLDSIARNSDHMASRIARWFDASEELAKAYLHTFRFRLFEFSDETERWKLVPETKLAAHALNHFGLPGVVYLRDNSWGDLKGFCFRDSIDYERNVALKAFVLNYYGPDQDPLDRMAKVERPVAMDPPDGAWQENVPVGEYSTTTYVGDIEDKLRALFVYNFRRVD